MKKETLPYKRMHSFNARPLNITSVFNDDNILRYNLRPAKYVIAIYDDHV
jgi:hypothetical protein